MTDKNRRHKIELSHTGEGNWQPNFLKGKKKYLFVRSRKRLRPEGQIILIEIQKGTRDLKNNSKILTDEIYVTY